MSTELSFNPGRNNDLAAIATQGGFDTLKALISSPLMGMVLTVAVIELLQGVQVAKGQREYVYDPQLGGHYRSMKEPLLSPVLANSLEAVIISTEALKSIGNSDLVKGLLPLAGKLL